MLITIHQPAYLPWLGLMSKIQNADLYVCLNTAQYEKNYVDNRNKIVRNNIEEWLTIPIQTSGKFKNNPLNKAKIAGLKEMGHDWKSSHWAKILQAYGKTKEQEFLNELEQIYKLKSDKLFDYQDASMRIIRKYLKIETPVLYSDKMSLTKTKSDLILEICQKLDATEYLSGPQGKDYLDEEKFKKAGIKILYHSWNLEYQMSSIHYILTYGYETTQKILKNNFKVEKT
jgi:hypothetical protein